MDRRVVSLIWMLFFAAGVSQAVTLTFNPATPMPGQTVEITVINQGCSPFLETEVRAPKGSTNGLIQIGVVDVCECIATPLPTPPLKAQIGPLPLGTYTTELLAVARNEGDPTCTGSTLVETGQLVVSNSGQIGVLRTDPPQPFIGQHVFAVISSYCPRAFLPARIETEGTQRVVVIEEDPFAPLPPIPCSSTPSFEHRIAIGPLDAGTYKLRVTPPPVNVLPPYAVEAEHVFTVAPAGPGLLLQGDRFRVRATWDSPEHGPSEAQAVPLTRESGYFWFANADNVELVAKVLDGCAVNDRFWVFLAGLTNLEVTVTVEDTLTGEIRSYTNALGTPFLPVQDTDAFKGCELGDPR
ncbi:MAG TPA: hypothetical protein VL025_22390 [Thermoanaerobaculia bacterium]|nr:hypothetical protein [Thermoanaerobaculia bacterium]